MIQKIPQIKSFGVFHDFQWPAGLPEFKQFNLIYGWNYSGKTTLSRAFRCFEQKQRHPDFSDAQVHLKSRDGSNHHLSAPENAPIFRVFNSDFVRENLRFDSASATPILVLGAEDIARQAALKTKKEEREALLLKKLANQTARDNKTAAQDGALTKDARDLIKNQLATPNYDRTKFLPKVNACKANPDPYLLADGVASSYLAIYRSTDKRPTITKKNISLRAISDMKASCGVLLAKVVTANKPIARLTSNPAIEVWVKRGQQLHEGKTNCEFCGQTLPHDLLTHISEHFSAEYQELMNSLEAMTASLRTAEDEKVELDAKAAFYPELHERFAAEKTKLDELLKARKAALTMLSQTIEAKKTKAFTVIQCPEIDDLDQRFSPVIAGINGIIDEHNSRTAEFDKKRQDAFAKLEMHYAAAFVRDQKYNQVLQEIADLKTLIAEQGLALSKLDAEILGLEKELSKATRGAERINELLAAYFGKNDLRIEATPDNAFQINRRDVVAKNLSEGERTAIAFAYFITRVQDGRHPIADTRVVIDDPVSSLDASHLFNTYALIKTQMVDCKQLFVSTHSFEFYNLVRDWLAEDEDSGYAKKPQSQWKKWSVFLVKKNDAGLAALEEIPKELLRFKSEYHFLFSTLYHYDKAGDGNFDYLLSLPNVVRRFMEAFGGIMIPLSTGLKGKMDRLFSDKVKRERVWKFINTYSHQTTITRSLTIPDTSECKAVVRACIEAVREWDADYLGDLEKEIN